MEEREFFCTWPYFSQLVQRRPGACQLKTSRIFGCAIIWFLHSGRSNSRFKRGFLDSWGSSRINLFSTFLLTRGSVDGVSSRFRLTSALSRDQLKYLGMWVNMGPHYPLMSFKQGRIHPATLTPAPPHTHSVKHSASNGIIFIYQEES